MQKRAGRQRVPASDMAMTARLARTRDRDNVPQAVDYSRTFHGSVWTVRSVIFE